MLTRPLAHLAAATTLTAILSATAVRPALAAQADDPQGSALDQLQSPLDFASQGEVNFKAGKYPAAVRDWRHALVDDPKNGAIVMLLAQGLFAVGQYDEAAGATQAAMQMLPPEKWGTVVTHYKELYTNVQDYTNQLRALEKARDANPESPALHFLLGYHFGYLGYVKHGLKELDKTLELAPKDQMAKKLRDLLAGEKVDGKQPGPGNADKPAGEGNPPAKEKKDDGTEA